MGDWSGVRHFKTPPSSDPAISTTLSRVKLSVTSGGRFHLVDAGLPMDGEIDAQGDRAVLRVESVVGRAQPPNNAQRITVSAQKDGTLLYENPDAPAPDPVVLEKSATSGPSGP